MTKEEPKVGKYSIYYSAEAAANWGTNSIILDDGREVEYTAMFGKDGDGGKYLWPDKIFLGYSSGYDKITRFGLNII